MMIRSSPDSLWLRPAASRFHSIVSFFPKELGTMQNFPALKTHSLCENQMVTLQLHDDSAESPRLRVASLPRPFVGAATSLRRLPDRSSHPFPTDSARCQKIPTPVPFKFTPLSMPLQLLRGRRSRMGRVPGSRARMGRVAHRDQEWVEFPASRFH